MGSTKILPPILASGTYEKFQEALTDGIFKNLDRTLWGYINEGEYAGQMIFVRPDDKIIHRIVGNNEATDEAIVEIKSVLETVNQDISDVKTTVASQESTIETLQNIEQELSTNVSEMKTTVESHSSAIADNAAAIGQNTQDIQAAQEDIQANSEAINGLRADTISMVQEVTNSVVDTQVELGNVSNTVDGISSDVSEAKTSIESLTTTTTALSDDVSDLKERAQINWV